MNPKVGIVLLNYNLPEETNYVYEKLKKALTKTNYEICVVDNASDKAAPSKYTTIKALVNGRTMGGLLLGAHYFNRKHDVKYVLYMHNDMDFDEVDWLEEIVQYMEDNENVAVVHPSINANEAYVPIGDKIVVTQPENPTGWRRVMPNSHGVIRMDDTSPIIVRKSDWNLVGGQDPRLSRCYNSGKDFYTALHRVGKEVWICDKVSIIHRGQYTYSSNVGDESYQTLDQEANRETHPIMVEKYGPEWRTIFASE